MKNLIVKHVPFSGDDLVAVMNKNNNKIYTGVSYICNCIGLTKDQKDRQVKNVQSDLVLKNGCRKFKPGAFDDNNVTLGIEFKYLPIWLSKINPKSLKLEEYSKVTKLLNWSLSEDFDVLKTPAKIYTFESELRDELFTIGYFNDIRITSKEVKYDFGRIDLEGVDSKGTKCVIELKRYKDYDDIISQCLKYRNGFKKMNISPRIIICMYNCNNILKKAIKNGFECYEYKRELKINKVV